MIEQPLYSEPMILPLDCNGELYAIQDEHGKNIGTGTREICEVLVHLMMKEASQKIGRTVQLNDLMRPNVRAAIVV